MNCVTLCLFLCFKNILKKHSKNFIFFLFQINNFLVFSNYFDVLILKIIFLKKKNYFNVFLK